MAFLTVEDLYGPTEIILFESAYQNCANVLMEDNIVLVNGRLSVREDEETKIVANQITEFATKKKSIFILDVTSLDEKTKVKLKGAIKFFTGDRNNMPLEIINNTVKSPFSKALALPMLSLYIVLKLYHLFCKVEHNLQPGLL